MTSFAGKVVLITGAANGIGRELAKQLAAEGARIAAVDLQEAALENLAADLDGKSVAWAVADVTDRPALLQAVRGLEEKLGPTDLLIASAGIGRETSALSFNGEDIADIIRVNLIGVVHSIDAVLPGMLQRRSGHLMALSSLASYRGFPKMAGYCASKAGVNGLLDALRVELVPAGIAVTTICPGWIRTNMTAPIATRLPRLLEVDDAARRIIEALRRRRPFVAFPARDTWPVRILRWLPAGISDWMVRRRFRRFLK